MLSPALPSPFFWPLSRGRSQPPALRPPGIPDAMNLWAPNCLGSEFPLTSLLLFPAFMKGPASPVSPTEEREAAWAQRSTLLRDGSNVTPPPRALGCSRLLPRPSKAFRQLPMIGTSRPSTHRLSLLRAEHSLRSCCRPHGFPPPSAHARPRTGNWALALGTGHRTVRPGAVQAPWASPGAKAPGHIGWS